MDFIVHHIGFDERGMIEGAEPARRARSRRGGRRHPGAGGRRLSIQQAIECPRRGAPLVVVGAPLVIDGTAFRPADADLFTTLRKICRDIRGAA